MIINNLAYHAHTHVLRVQMIPIVFPVPLLKIGWVNLLVIASQGIMIIMKNVYNVFIHVKIALILKHVLVAPHKQEEMAIVLVKMVIMKLVLNVKNVNILVRIVHR